MVVSWQIVAFLPSVLSEQWQDKGPRNVVITCWMVRIMTNMVIVEGSRPTVIHVNVISFD